MVLVWKTIQEAQLQLKQSWNLHLKGVVIRELCEHNYSQDNLDWKVKEW